MRNPDVLNAIAEAQQTGEDASASFSDPGTGDTHTATWEWGDGSTSAGTVGSGAVGPNSHTYTTPGVYTVQLTVTDNQGATSTATLGITVNAGATPPAAPSNLSASANRTTLTLTWNDNSSNESGFYVERAAKAKNLQFTRIAAVAANVRALTRTETPGQWVYRVQSYNAAGTSPYSNSATIKVR